MVGCGEAWRETWKTTGSDIFTQYAKCACHAMVPLFLGAFMQSATKKARGSKQARIAAPNCLSLVPSPDSHGTKTMGSWHAYRERVKKNMKNKKKIFFLWNMLKLEPTNFIEILTKGILLIFNSLTQSQFPGEISTFTKFSNFFLNDHINRYIDTRDHGEINFVRIIDWINVPTSTSIIINLEFLIWENFIEIRSCGPSSLC